MEEIMSDDLGQAISQLTLMLGAQDAFVDSRPQGQARAAYLPTGTTTCGPIGEHIKLRQSLATEILVAVGQVEGLLKVSLHAEGVARYIAMIRASLDQTGAQRPRVEKELIERLNEECAKREGALAASERNTSVQSGTPDPHIFRIGPLEIDSLSRRVSLNGESHVIKNPAAFQAFLLIAKAEGALVTTAVITENVSGCKGRLDVKFARHLTPWLRDLIPGQTGRTGGYSLQLPDIVRNDAR
jgi:hypothetical protein